MDGFMPKYYLGKI